MLRKSIDVSEALFSKNVMNRKLMNDIMFYLRKLIKLARRAQSLSLTEGAEVGLISKELDDIGKKIYEIEKTMEI